MRDPFFIDGPACINFSGGRSSALMLRRCLDAHGGFLPSDVHVVFANTGRERAATLDFVRECALRWGVWIRWVERDGSGEPGARFREVEYETASRTGEPFAELIDEHRFLPNAVARFCTIELKILVARDFMRAEGHAHWTSVVGLRRDEPARVSKVRARENPEWDVACPLYDARVRAADVTAFWAAQPFDLALKPWEGNCDLCFLKGRAKRERIVRDRPELAAWWVEQERRIGGRFHAHERGYAALAERVRRLPLLPMDLAPEHDDSLPCGCTDRRPARRRTCTCNKRPGEGHTLACRRVFGEAA
jgi:3'-phosphoadenosine 5'-phosphosulfate sulfotransferase (PAPS reductase)/FAD synthetase